MKTKTKKTAASEESAVRTSGLVGRSATGRSKGDCQAGHCTTGHVAFPTSTAGDSFFFLEAAFLSSSDSLRGWQLLRKEYMQIRIGNENLKKNGFPPPFWATSDSRHSRQAECKHGKVRMGIFTRPRHTQQVEIASIVEKRRKEKEGKSRKQKRKCVMLYKSLCVSVD